MALYPNRLIDYQSPGRFTGSVVNMSTQNPNDPATKHRFRQFAEITGVPNGYEGSDAWNQPLKSGGMATYGTILGTSTMTVAQSNGVALSATLPAVSAFTIEMSAKSILATTMAATSGMSVDMFGGLLFSALLDATSTLVADGEFVAQMEALSAASSGMSVTATMVSVMETVMVGTSDISTAFMSLGRYFESTMPATSGITVDASPKAELACRMDVGAKPSVEEIVYGVWMAFRDTYKLPGSFGEALGMVLKFSNGRMRSVGSTLTFYDEDGTTPLAEFDLLNADGDPAVLADDVVERVPK